LLVTAVLAVIQASCSSAGVPSVVVRKAELYNLPGANRPDIRDKGYIDCNNPAHWDGDTMYVFQSAGHPYRSHGPDLWHLSKPSVKTVIDNQEGYKGHRWIESTHKDEDGTLYGWYHREPGKVCPNTYQTAPNIGAAVSDDNGLNWRDLGIVLTAPDDSVCCRTANKYFAGGNGDFSVILDREKRYFYFFISTYNRDPKEQGVSVARMPYDDRKDPVGKVLKWHKGRWSEAGLGGHVTPIFPVAIDWHRPNANALWGPSIHYNTYLNQYVILLNLAKNKHWAQEGIYITFNGELANPRGWTEPVKIVDAAELMASKWYPQVMGIDRAARETDKLAGKVARLLVAGKSKWELVFLRPGEKQGQ
jgi:hypothetical protein